MTIQPIGFPTQINGFKQARSAREVEYDAFSRVNRALIAASKGRGSLARAAADSVELWTLLATDLVSEGNALPESLRASLISLSIFAIRQGHQIMGGKCCPVALIGVNMSMMKGLRGELAA